MHCVSAPVFEQYEIQARFDYLLIGRAARLLRSCLARFLSHSRWLRYLFLRTNVGFAGILGTHEFLRRI